MSNWRGHPIVAAVKLGLKQLDIYSHSPTQAVLFAEHGADNPVKIVFMPLSNETCHHYVVDDNAAEPQRQPQPEPKKEEPMPIVDFHKAKAEIKAKPQPAPDEPAKVTTIAEAKERVEHKAGGLTAAELAEIAAITNGLMAEQAAANS